MIKIKIKDATVHIGELNYELITVARVICRVYDRYNKIPVLTSANDNKHAPNSWHYKNLGWDFRIWGIDDPNTPQNEMGVCAEEIRIELNAIDYHFTVFYGDPDHLDHMHIEYNLTKQRG